MKVRRIKQHEENRARDRFYQKERPNRRDLGVSRELKAECDALLKRMSEYRRNSAELGAAVHNLMARGGQVPVVMHVHWRYLMLTHAYQEACEVALRYAEKVKSAAGYSMLGMTCAVMDNVAEAIRYFALSLSLHPDQITYGRLHELLYSEKDWDQAEANARSWCSRKPSREAYNALAEVHRKQHKYYEAVVALANIPENKKTPHDRLCEAYCYFHLEEWQLSYDAFLRVRARPGVRSRESADAPSLKKNPGFRWYVGIVYLYERFIRCTRISEEAADDFLQQLYPFLEESVHWISSQRLDDMPEHQQRDFVSALNIIVHDTQLWSIVLSEQS